MTVEVRLQVWRIPLSRVPGLLMDRRRGSATFSKLLGTGPGYLPGQADLTRWARLSVGPPPPAPAYATESWQVDLRPLSSRGRWSRKEPFGHPQDHEYVGKTAVLTRARLAPSKALTFWRAVPPVAHQLDRAPGLRVSLAIGEAPLGLQGTFSVWDSAADLRAFAHAGAHREVIARTSEVGWYAEELFARFAVLASAGTLNGSDPLA